MGTLHEQLERIRAGFSKKAPESAKTIMHRATDDLRASGILERIPQPGDPLPSFELPDAAGNPVRSSELLAQGPLVLSFYRGLW